MIGISADDITRLNDELWTAADTLRANSKLTSSDYFMPVLGVIFLRHAANRFAAAERGIAADQASGKMPPRPVRSADFVARRSLYLPETARYDWILRTAGDGAKDLPTLVNEAMLAIEASFPPLAGVLPKDYGIFEAGVLESLMRLFDTELMRRASGDVFGRIYEYFLAKFSIQKAHDNGEFFTPSSIVQMLVSVTEPDHGKVFDPACGSGGMFVQSSHFVEQEGEDPARRVVFFGQEKNPDTIRLAKMNLAVHGLEGDIREAITYYQDEHELVGKCDFVLANPPFNVDLVDAERVEGDPRLPFGLPGVNKQKKVGNANYLWISYFWSYLHERGRAGFVMSSQASSAGHGEKEVRRKLVETGDVDVMVAVRGNFFYTRTVPCELWHLDRGKPAERRDVVLMLDARHVYRKVTRTIYDFSPEQLQNLAAIVWLYRGERARFLALVGRYLAAARAESERVAGALAAFDERLAEVRARLDAVTDEDAGAGDETREAFLDARRALAAEVAPYATDARRVLGGLAEVAAAPAVPDDNAAQHAVRLAFEPRAEALRGLVKQVDQLHRLAARVADRAAALAAAEGSGTEWNRREASRLLKALDEARHAAAEQMRLPAYFHRQAAWLHERFPDAELRDVPGLVKLAARAEIAAADWSLSPGRYVGVAPSEEDDEFDFEGAMRDIQAELSELDSEAVILAASVQATLQSVIS